MSGSPELVTRSGARLRRRGGRRNGRTGGTWDEGGRPRGETSDGEIAELVQDQDGANEAWAGRNAQALAAVPRANDRSVGHKIR